MINPNDTNKALMELLGITQKRVLEFTLHARANKFPVIELTTPVTLGGRHVIQDGKFASNVQRFRLAPIEAPAAPAAEEPQGFDLDRMVYDALIRLEVALEGDVYKHLHEMRRGRWRKA